MKDASESAEDDYFYSGRDDDPAGPAYAYNGDDDADVADYEFNDSDDSDDIVSYRHQLNYTILSEADIRQRLEKDVTTVSTVLSIPKVSARVLLRFYKWSVSKVYDEWFADEGKVRKSVGLLEKPVFEFPNAKDLNCGICLETYPCDSLHAAACGHPFCNACWAGYISTSINDGPGCLMLRCPVPSCGAAVDQDMINLFTSEKGKEMYSRYFVRSYVEDNRKTKWCPSPDCNFAVDFVVGSGNYDVTCRCSYKFCWNCTEEAHRPVDCGTVAKWVWITNMVSKNSESENVNWILTNCKPCPKCKRPIEKNQGCLHMTCAPPCKFEFCWICLGAWSEHGKWTGGVFACNRYDESEKQREMAKNSLDRCTHYYQRWAANQLEWHNIECQPESQLKFITQAWLQIVECRRVLKWTYAYGYYLPEHEHAKRLFFEYLQGEAERRLLELHQCAEEGLQVSLHAEGPSQVFNEFQTKLAQLTSVTRNHFKKFVQALENGLSEVDTHAACSKRGSSRNVGGI